MAQLMPLPFTVSCFSKTQIGFTFLVPAHSGSPGKRAVKRVCVCVCVCEGCLCTICTLTPLHTCNKPVLSCQFEDVQKLFLCWQIEHTVGFTKYVWCCYTGESCAEVNTEVDSNKVTERLHNDKPRPFVCDRRSIQKERLCDHRSRQTGENEYVCDHCKKRFLSKSNLIVHMNMNAYNYRCTECGKRCRSGSDLAVHSRSHSGEKPFECTVCGKRFTQSGSLLNHSRIHSGQKPYKCHVCDKAFSRSGTLNAHMRVHTGEKPLKCSLCDTSFSQSSNLQTHKRLVHSNSRPYECPYCGMLFKIHSRLKQHVRIHTDAKPYSCSHCSECFTWHGQLKTHLLKSHNEGTWFTCDICQMKLTTKWNLKVHVQQHEAVKPNVCSNFQSVSIQQMNWGIII